MLTERECSYLLNSFAQGLTADEALEQLQETVMRQNKDLLIITPSLREKVRQAFVKLNEAFQNGD